MIGAINNTMITVACVGCFVFGFFISSQFEKANKFSKLEAAIKEKNQVEAERLALEEKLNAARAVQSQKAKVIIKKVDHEVKKVVYTECIVPDDGVRLINEAAGYVASL